MTASAETLLQAILPSWRAELPPALAGDTFDAYLRDHRAEVLERLGAWLRGEGEGARLPWWRVAPTIPRHQDTDALRTEAAAIFEAVRAYLSDPEWSFLDDEERVEIIHAAVVPLWEPDDADRLTQAVADVDGGLRDEDDVIEEIAAALRDGTDPELELHTIPPDAACDFVRIHHRHLPECNRRGIVHALAARWRGQIVAVALAGTPTGRWGRASSCPPEGTLEITRVASIAGLRRYDRRGRLVPVGAASALTIHRDPDATWNTAKIAAALVALDFPEELARQVADAARRALATVTALDLLTRDFFDAWAVRFTEHTANLFAVAADRHLARDLVEAQMLAPWFALPKREPARTLALPPEPSPDELAAQPRALLRDLLAARLPAEEARRRVRTHDCIRRLVAAVAELYGPDARLVGDLLAPAIVIHRGGRPVLHHVTTLLGERTAAAPDLTSDDRYTIERRLADLRARLVDAVATEHTCCFGEDDDGRAIDLVLQRLRAEITSTSRATIDTATTITLTPEQRLWLLDLLAGFVEDDDASRDKTEEGPPPPQVEWARALAERLSAEIAALADEPTT